MLLRNLQINTNSGNVDLLIEGGIIKKIDEHIDANELSIAFDNAIALPGLINSHDHLEFNLYPALGNIKYQHYKDWATHIHKEYKSEINEVLNVPERLRIEWGCYKNLINGVTTVVNHGKHLPVANNNYIDVIQDQQSLHSVEFESGWQLKLNNPFSVRKKAVIHIGEGIDEAAKGEVYELIKWNLSNRPLIGVHGVAMNSLQASKFEALVWCPMSNYFMFNKTADIKKINSNTEILFGSDSTLTADWSIWNHLKFADELQLLSREELLQSITVTPAKIWGLKYKGALVENNIADIVVIEKTGNDFLNSFVGCDVSKILLSIKNGRIVLIDESLLPVLKNSLFNDELFSTIRVNNREKKVIGRLDDLTKTIKKYYNKVYLPFEIEC